MTKAEFSYAIALTDSIEGWTDQNLCILCANRNLVCQVCGRVAEWQPAFGVFRECLQLTSLHESLILDGVRYSWYAHKNKLLILLFVNVWTRRLIAHGLLRCASRRPNTSSLQHDVQPEDGLAMLKMMMTSTRLLKETYSVLLEMTLITEPAGGRSGVYFLLAVCDACLLRKEQEEKGEKSQEIIFLLSWVQSTVLLCRIIGAQK